MTNSGYGTGAAHIFYALAWIALIIGIVLWFVGFFDKDQARETLAIGRSTVFLIIALVFAIFVLITFGFQANREKICSSM